MFKLILSCLLFYLPEAILLERSTIIETVSGPVRGKLNEFNGIEFYTYQGIPYAESPAGEMRFKPPVPKKSWTNIFDATKEGTICSQVTRFYPMKNTTEDCLNLNVYVPKNATANLLPVLVFIHGGALQCLSGRNDINYGPQFLLTRDVIYVSMNYRLGIFGFLSLDIEEASGNAGLKDVLLSLKWVKQNIKSFGGDPDRITIAGHSSGSLIVNFLLLTNQSVGLFNRAILFSGSAFSPRSFAKHSKEITYELAKELGIETDNVYKTLERLKKIDTFTILSAYDNISMRHDSPIRVYAPFVVSKEVESDHALFVMDPMEALRKINLTIQKVPVLIGITSREAMNTIPYVLTKNAGFEKIRENPEYLIPSNIEYPIGSPRSKNLAKLISKMYFGENMENFSLATFIDFTSDTQNVYGPYFWIENYRNTVVKDPLYLYIFDFDGNLNQNKSAFNTSLLGIGHGDDIPYIFLAQRAKSLYNSIDERTRRMMDRMITFISNFIHYGNPTPANINNDFLWPDYTKEQNYLLINDNPVVQPFNTHPIYSRMQFWDKVYNEYFKYLENGGEIQRKIIP